MPQFESMPVDRLLRATHTLYTNARDDAEIAADLVEFGYTNPDDYDAGLALRTAVTDGLSAQSKEAADETLATRAAQRATAQLRARYVRHRSAARRAHRSGTEGYTALHLAGPTPDARDAILSDARHFYDTLTAHPHFHDRIRGLDAAAITDAQALIAALDTATAAQAKESGEAQRATVTLNDALDALRAHSSELAYAAQDALADKPQLREKLGLLERS